MKFFPPVTFFRAFTPRAARATFAVLGALTLASVHPHASAATLADAELRSYFGEPLHVRITVAPGDEEVLDASCFSLGNDSQPSGTFRDARLALVELGRARYVTVRTNSSVNEPYVKLVLRYSCPGLGSVARDYTLLLDPPTANNIARPATGNTAADEPTKTALGPAAKLDLNIASTASANAATTSVTAPTIAQWTVRAGDTLAGIARGIYPRSVALQARFLAVARAQNPALANVADDAPLEPGSAFVLPDLRRLVDDRAARRSASGAPPSMALPTIPAGSEPAPAPSRKKRATAAPSPSAASDPAAAPKAKPPSKSSKAAKSSGAAKSGDFSLRISGGEIDLARSKGVTEEQRSVLREKQAMLDADDQVAQFLALKNTVRQLEIRLNSLQAKVGIAPNGTPLVASTSVSPPPTSAPSSAPTTPVPGPAAQPPAPAAATPAPTPAPESAPPTPPVAKTAPTPVASAAPAKPVAGSASSAQKRGDNVVTWGWGSIYVWGTLLLVVIAVAGAIWWWRRPRARLMSVEELMAMTPVEEPAGEAGVRSAAAAPDDDLTPEQARVLAAAKAREAALHEADERAMAEMIRARQGQGQSSDSASTSRPDIDAPVEQKLGGETDLDLGLDFELPPSAAAEEAKSTKTDTRLPAEIPEAVFDQAFAKTVVLDQPIQFDTPARFELDDTPSTVVDFPLGDEPQLDARLQRVQYMHERYPELRNNTVSIDNAASVVNAARLYYDEGAVDKACELLTFGIEERPQEMSFWLAQFEIYRRTSMPTEFTALAHKFEMFFSQSSEWQKVRGIGQTLAPGEALFKPNGERSRAYDPEAENWLGNFADAAHTVNATNFRQHMLRAHSLQDSDLGGGAAP